MPSTWCSENDVVQFLASAGMEMDVTAAERALDISGAIAGAITEFERAVHYEPFVSTGVDVTEKYDASEVKCPPNDSSFLDLRGGFTAITSFRVGVTNSSAGTLLVQDTNYYPYPKSYAAKGKPISWVEFESWPWVGIGFGTMKNSIQITGKRGYSMTCPDWAFQAVMKRAASNLCPALSVLISGGLLSWKEADATSETYGANPLSAFQQSCDAAFARSVRVNGRKPIW